MKLKGIDYFFTYIGRALIVYSICTPVRITGKKVDGLYKSTYKLALL